MYYWCTRTTVVVLLVHKQAVFVAIQSRPVMSAQLVPRALLCFEGAYLPALDYSTTNCFVYAMLISVGPSSNSCCAMLDGRAMFFFSLLLWTLPPVFIRRIPQTYQVHTHEKKKGSSFFSCSRCLRAVGGTLRRHVVFRLPLASFSRT